jgi:hypothetical protein
MTITNKDRRDYSNHKSGTRGRTDRHGNPIAFNISLEEWVNWWHETGHYHERGPRKDQYVMARIGDLGNYELGNIECKTQAENAREGQLGRVKGPLSAAAKDNLREKRKLQVCSDETRQKMRLARLGKPLPEETKQKLRKPKNRIKPTTTKSVVACPHCGTTGQPSNMKRWHGDNCKLK